MMAFLTKLSSSLLRSQNILQNRLQSAVGKQFCQCHCLKGKPSTQNTTWRPSFTPIRFFKTRPTRVSPTEGRAFGSLLKPFGFTVLVSTASFGGAILWQYESLRALYNKKYVTMKSDESHLYYGKAGSFRHHTNSMWNRLNPGQKLVAEIIAVNIGVFLLWKVRPLQNFMVKYFTSSPFSGARCSSMMLSTFSQHSVVHLACNMFVLWSFAMPVTQALGREQFLAFFLAAGVISSFTSYINKVARFSRVPSVGASGAILAVIGAVCCQFPESRLSILLIDKIVPHSFSADSAMKGIIIIDIAGILFGWKLFDHAAHLGGILFGIWYQKYGQHLVWKQGREPLMKFWHELRGKP